MTLIDICSYAVKEAIKEHSNQVEAYATLHREAEVFLENSDLKQVKSHLKGSIGVRVFVNKSLGFASVNSLDRQKVSDTVSKAIKIAKVTPKDRHNVLPVNTKVKLLRGIYDPNAEHFRAADATRSATDMLNDARSYDPRVSVDSGTFNSSLITHAICNSNGAKFEEKISVFSWSIMGMAINGNDVSNFDFQFDGTHSVKNIDVTATSEEFAKSVVNSLDSRKINSLNGTMLLSPNALYELVQDSITFAINSHNVQKGTSSFAKMLGKKVASKELTVVDDATLIEGLGAESFDREGVAHKKNVIINKGVLKRYIYNTYTAKKDRTNSTGNATGGASSPPSIGSTNIIVESGKHKLDSIISEIRKGVMVNRFSGNINAVNGDFSGVVKGGRLIEEGSLTYPVREVMVAGNIFDALKKISAISRERRKIFDSILPYISVEGISFTGG